AHPCIIAKDAAKMFFVGENFILHGKKYTGAIYQVDNGKEVLHRDLLHPEIFLSSNWKPGAGFYGLVIGDDHALTTANITNTGHCTTSWASSLFSIHIKPGESAYFDKGFVLINKVFYSFSCGQLVFVLLFLRGLLSASLVNLFQ